ncbi:conjugal transfer protein TraG N-terminal domain-containing protein, partial [Thermodesulfovibrio sp.]|uniref:conjugal transfer protein TraG N-terminal domain-containing protein n=1 Tax=Thermodesulfovibrio sp. TaxID=2067987 RepID=UPI003D138575
MTNLLGSNSFLSQQILAQNILEVVSSTSPENAIKTLATSQSMSSFIGMAAHANSWVPVIKETLTALAIGLTPLFALLVITPLAGRAFSVMAGMLIWLTAWGIIDAVVHSFAMEFAFNSSESLKDADGASGLTAMLMFPSYTTKVAALFGALRWFGLMLSSILTAMLIKFGGTALAMLAGTLAGAPQASGASAGSGVLTNPGHVMSSDLVPKQAWANVGKAIGEKNLVRGLINVRTGGLAGEALVGDVFSADDIAQAKFLNEGSNIAYTATVGNKLFGQARSTGLSTKEALGVLGAGGMRPGGVLGILAAARSGRLTSGPTFEDRVMQGQLLNAQMQQIAPGIELLKTSNTEYLLGPDGSLIPVRVDTGQFSIKEAASRIWRSKVEAQSGKAISEDYQKLFEFAIGKKAVQGVSNETVRDFVSEVSKRMFQKIGQSDELR